MNIADRHFAGALERLGGDKVLFRDLVGFFIEDAPRLLRAIYEGLAMGNAINVQRAAHSLRSLAANFDAEEATCFAASIEQMAARGDLHGVPAAAAQLENEIQALWHVLNHRAMEAAPPRAES
jgi:two-component system, sensor histidine kinase and response regulator